MAARQRPGRNRPIRLVLPALLALAGCGLFGEDDEILEGERIAVRPPETMTTSTASVPLALPPARAIAEWGHRNATPSHMAPHAELAGALRLVWTADAGTGDNDRSGITSGPVTGGGRIYTLDAAATVSAFGPGGARLWQREVGREGEDGRDGFGGGLAFADGMLFVATGFGEVLALDPASGEIRWRTSVDAPVRAAPTVRDGRIYAVTRDDRGFALDTKDGQVLWRAPGAIGITGLLGGASPAADEIIAVLPFSSGEVTAVIAATGRRIWSAAITGGRRGLARANIGDVTGDPVIDGERIYAANQSGRLVAIDRRSGARLWTANVGSLNPVLAAGSAVFVISDAAELQRLDAATGAVVWSTALPQWDDPEDRDGAIAYGGPILAGGRLVLVSDEGRILSFDPESGRETGSVEFPGGSHLGPAVTDGTLYVLTSRGQLLAFR